MCYFSVKIPASVDRQMTHYDNSNVRRRIVHQIAMVGAVASSLQHKLDSQNLLAWLAAT